MLTGIKLALTHFVTCAYKSSQIGLALNISYVTIAVCTGLGINKTCARVVSTRNHLTTMCRYSLKTNTIALYGVLFAILGGKDMKALQDLLKKRLEGNPDSVNYEADTEDLSPRAAENAKAVTEKFNKDMSSANAKVAEYLSRKKKEQSKQ
jgi:hypothetical protein